MKFATYVFASLLTACGAAPTVKTVLLEDVTVSVTEDPTLKKRGEARIMLKDGKPVQCRIILKRYPVCLLHELRHCIEGDWHPRDEPNTEDC